MAEYQLLAPIPTQLRGPARDHREEQKAVETLAPHLLSLAQSNVVAVSRGSQARPEKTRSRQSRHEDVGASNTGQAEPQA